MHTDFFILGGGGWDLTIRPVTPVIYISLLPSRGATPPPCNASAEGGARWRLQYDVYQHFLPENDLSEQSLFAGVHAVADVPGTVKNSKWVDYFLVLTMLLGNKCYVVGKPVERIDHRH